MIDETTLNLVDRYGLPLIALIVLVFFMWRWVLPKLDDAWSMYVGAARKPEIRIQDIFRADMEMNALLVEILRETCANWAIIWQFHNGGTNLNGFPFLRVSATHEQTDINHDRIAQSYQNLPTSLFIDGTRKYDISKINTETLLLHDNKAHAARGLMRAHGMAIMQASTLRDTRGDVVGFLTVSYSDKDTSFADCKSISEYAERAQTLLDLRTRVKELEGE